MKKTVNLLSVLSVVILLISCQKMSSNTIKVTNIEELNAAIKNAKAGDEIVLANGVWKDVQIKFYGKGTKDKPIVLRAETAGKVFIEGESDLKIGGDYLEVSGLYFKNGHTPSDAIIAFNIDSNKNANNCKVTDCVIEEFTQPDRAKQDHWIEFWGRNNQLDHCYIAGKSNDGPTVRVFLKGNEHINNYHQITNNHFGPRPRKGGPHGETMQIGDSYTSMSPSYTNVSNNFFERCNGEVEIISSKSNFNEFRNNIFFESEGSLVLRHGNYATIDGNIFIGNDNSEFIGGVRVVNTGHWITNNYFYKVKGDEFRSALAVMNGIPKSPLNRYNQVTDVVVAYNSFIECKTPFQFSVGANIDKSKVLPASEIRSARPIRTIVANNLIFNQKTDENLVKSYDEVDGITFKNNLSNSLNKSEFKGIATKEFEVKKLADWLYVPIKNDTAVYIGFDFENIKNDLFGRERAKGNSIGAITLPVDINKIAIDKKMYGTKWFSNEKAAHTPIVIKASTNKEIVEGLKKAKDGDVIVLTAPSYLITESLVINKQITIKSKDKNHKAEIFYSGAENTPAFQMNPKGNLILESIVLRGNKAQNAFATLDKEMAKAYNLWIKNAQISDFKSVLKVSKGSFADTISIANTVIKNCLNGIQLAEENDDKGDYNAEFVYIINSEFENVQSEVLNYYRGGYDESTIGGNLVIKNNKFTNCGKMDKSGVLLQTIGIVNVLLMENTFTNNAVKLIAILWGEKKQKPIDNKIINSGKIEIQQNLIQKMMY
ncbi:MAG: alginate lyase [Flavobacteria bacterium RIFCSPLOWO2_12_FULL_35_11]|nr:MAG: alginate lyase [Flavobacteria bacterium RIFCSPLOWO2_12_FULL_35_11]